MERIRTRTPFYVSPLRWPGREARAKALALWFGPLPLGDQLWAIAEAFAAGTDVDIIQRAEYLLGLLPCEVAL